MGQKEGDIIFMLSNDLELLQFAVIIQICQLNIQLDYNQNDIRQFRNIQIILKIMTTRTTKSSQRTQFNQQQFQAMLDNFMNKSTPTQPIDIGEIINSAKEVTSQNLQQFEITKMKKKMDSIAQQTVSKYQQIRQKQLLSEIEQLREQNRVLQDHVHEVTVKYQQKREQSNRFMQQYEDLNSKYEQLCQQYMHIEKQYTKRQQNIIRNHETQIKEEKQKQQQQQQQYKRQIKQIECHNKYLAQLLSRTQAEYEKIKQIYDKEKEKRKQKQIQFKDKNDVMQKQLSKCKLEIVNLNKFIAELNKKIMIKNQQLGTLEKMLREMNDRVNKIQTDTQRQLMRERSITKKAMEGLQITRKYSQLQLSKSRKKEKQYINHQKQLIGKIKEICKQQSLCDTTDKWERKSSIKSLNTTLKLSKPDRQSSSPFVSNFMADEESYISLSPIHHGQTSKDQALKIADKNLQKSRSTVRLTKPKYRIQIPNMSPTPQSQATGTPCFQSQKQTMFKAKN